MTKQEIDGMAEELTTKMQNINGWIRRNPDTEPNFHQIMECSVDTAVVLSHMKEHYDYVGYPQKPTEEAAESMSRYTHYDIAEFDEHAKACWGALSEMRTLRGVGRDKSEITAEKPCFSDSGAPYDFLVEFDYRAWSGEYEVLKHDHLARVKKEILCQSMSIPFFIWQEQRKNPDFKYENVEEFEKLKSDYQMYCEVSQMSQYRSDNANYDGPQFGMQIEGLLEQIEKSYKYSEQYGNQEGNKTM